MDVFILPYYNGISNLNMKRKEGMIMIQLSSRQIHLDFHTSENISGIGADFDPEAFAKTAKDA